ncbi:hypothetical protein LIER_22126 [Lithospermum erythrorhizon]|uniref:Uncharacterized protein n=1 Tax=Lithospermum erythrorhizon TaxID=34254 RepID=A0AAV3QSN2_LITER
MAFQRGIRIAFVAAILICGLFLEANAEQHINYGVLQADEVPKCINKCHHQYHNRKLLVNNADWIFGYTYGVRPPRNL